MRTRSTMQDPEKKMNKEKLSVKWKLVALAVAAAVILLDRLTKIIAVASLVDVGKSATAIPGVLDFTYVLNDGATAGMLADHRWVFMVASTVVIIGITLFVALGKVSNKFTVITLAMIVGGGIGNMIDRVFDGSVVDFIDVTLVNFFPFNTVFNVADVFVCIGCIMLAISVIVDEVKEYKRKKAAKAADAADGGDKNE